MRPHNLGPLVSDYDPVYALNVDLCEPYSDWWSLPKTEKRWKDERRRETLVYHCFASTFFIRHLHAISLREGSIHKNEICFIYKRLGYQQQRMAYHQGKDNVSRAPIALQLILKIKRSQGCCETAQVQLQLMYNLSISSINQSEPISMMAQIPSPSIRHRYAKCPPS